MASRSAMRFPIFVAVRVVGIFVTLLLFVWAQRYRGGIALVSKTRSIHFPPIAEFTRTNVHGCLGPVWYGGREWEGRDFNGGKGMGWDGRDYIFPCLGY